MPTRLPVPGSDEGQWGDILNQFLSVEHNSDGTLKASGSLSSKANVSDLNSLSSTVDSKYSLAPGGIPETDLSSAVQTKLNATGGGEPASGSITNDKIADGAITNSKVSSSAAISQSKIENLTADLASKVSSTDLSTVATSGDYADLTGTPTISTDHGDMTGLSDDDHPQYHNDTRGDARYYTKAQIDSSLGAKASTTHQHSWQDLTTGTQPAPVSHTHDQADVTGLATALSGKADASHTHAITDVTNLDDTLSFLDSEVPRGHTVYYDGVNWPARPSIVAPRYVVWDSMAYVDASQPPGMINLDRWKPHPNSEIYDALT